MKVLFVCMGNICRSPTAEGVFRAHVRRHAPALDIEIDSAGTHAYHVGEPPDPRTIAGGRAPGHRPCGPAGAAGAGRRLRALRPDRCDGSPESRDSCSTAARPSITPRIRTLLEFAGKTAPADVPDPYYGGAKGFDDVLDLVESAADGLLAEVRRRSGVR